MSEGTILTEGVAVPADPPSTWLSPNGDGIIDRPLDAYGHSLSPAAILKRQRVESGEQVEHLIETVRWGPDRLTTCSACDFTATGQTNEKMAARWNSHSSEMKHLDRRSGPVTSSLGEEVA